MTRVSPFQFFKYRVSTILKSFKILYTLPREKVDAFLDSYTIYDHDWIEEKALIEEMGENYYEEVKKKLIDYYSVLNHLCSLGQVEKMYIPPALDLSKSIIANQNLFEEKMAKDLGITPDDKVLDLGCGRGRIASHIASFTQGHVTGINIDEEQLSLAKKFAKAKGLSEKCHFQKGDINDTPFPFADNSFDAIYQVQVFSYAKDLEKLAKELFRILKPGARFACLDWVHFDAYNPKNPHHMDLMKRIKPLIGAIGTLSSKTFVSAIEKAGFTIKVSENISIDGKQAPLIENADRFFTRMYSLIRFFVRCKILPKHFQELFERLTKDGEAFVEADKMGLITTSYYILAEKP